jgi:hypothetical protein
VRFAGCSPQSALHFLPQVVPLFWRKPLSVVKVGWPQCHLHARIGANFSQLLHC